MKKTLPEEIINHKNTMHGAVDGCGDLGNAGVGDGVVVVLVVVVMVVL